MAAGQERASSGGAQVWQRQVRAWPQLPPCPAGLTSAAAAGGPRAAVSSGEGSKVRGGQLQSWLPGSPALRLRPCLSAQVVYPYQVGLVLCKFSRWENLCVGVICKLSLQCCGSRRNKQVFFQESEEICPWKSFVLFNAVLGRVGGASSPDAASTRTPSLCRSPASPPSRARGSAWQWHCAHGTVTGRNCALVLCQRKMKCHLWEGFIYSWN